MKSSLLSYKKGKTPLRSNNLQRGVFLLFFVIPLLSYSQQKLEILNANTLKFDENLGNGAKRLIGDVKFKHDDAIMLCDSAYFYSDNSLNAFGNVHIQEGDSVHLYGNLLKYDGNTRKAIISENVIVTKGDMKLSTDILNYNMSTSTGYYTTGANIINNENILTSKQGYFLSKLNVLKFKNNVVLTNQDEDQKEPQFVISCDTMNYNTSSKIAYFIGPTTITSDENMIYCEDGLYDTDNDLSRFSKNSYILTEEQKMLGDSLYYNRNTGIGKAIKNVQIIDTSQNIVITGNYAIHYEHKELAIVTDSALLTQITDNDTLYLHADTLKSRRTASLTKSIDSTEIKDSISIKKDNYNHQLFAYNRVKIFKNDLQGKCDSLVYLLSDSIMKMMGTPTLWSGANQLTSDTILVHTGDTALKSIELIGSAFIVSKEDSLHFNQIRGKYMQGFFHDTDLYLIEVEGNGQTVYYAKEDDEIKAVNRADCSDLKVYLKDSEIDRINFITKPEATIFPLDQIDVNELRLKNFTWRSQHRPHTVSDIFTWQEKALR